MSRIKTWVKAATIALGLSSLQLAGLPYGISSPPVLTAPAEKYVEVNLEELKRTLKVYENRMVSTEGYVGHHGKYYIFVPAGVKDRLRRIEIRYYQLHPQFVSEDYMGPPGLLVREKDGDIDISRLISRTSRKVKVRGVVKSQKHERNTTGIAGNIIDFTVTVFYLKPLHAEVVTENK